MRGLSGPARDRGRNRVACAGASISVSGPRGIERRTPSIGSKAAGIVVHDYCGHPFQLQLSRELARRGHRRTSPPLRLLQHGKGRGEGRRTRAHVEAVTLSREFARYSPWTRLRQERDYGAKSKRTRRAGSIPDVVLSANTPLVAQKFLLSESKRLGSRFVFWQQDLLGIGIRRVLSRRYGRLGAAIGNRFVALERSLLMASDAVVVISRGFLPALEELRIPADRIHVVENWAPIDELPLRPRANQWAGAQDLLGKRVVLYSGTLGLKHDPAVILDLARDLSEQNDVEIVVVSEGRGADWLRRRRDDEGLARSSLASVSTVRPSP